MQVRLIPNPKRYQIIRSQIIDRSLRIKILYRHLLMKRIIQRVNNLRGLKQRITLISSAHIQRNQTRHPSLTMNHIRRPAKLLQCLHRPLTEKNHPVHIVFKWLPFRIFKHRFPLKEIIIVQKVNLNPAPGQRSHFNNQRIIIVIHNDIHPRQPNHLMQPMPALIHRPKTRHQNSDFATIIVQIQR